MSNIALTVAAVRHQNLTALSSAIYWFRNDLRLHDNPAFSAACAQSAELLLVHYLGSPSAMHNGDTRWGKMQTSTHRQQVLIDTLIDLDASLRSGDSGLTVFPGAPADTLPKLGRALRTRQFHCEQVAAIHEEDELAALRATGCDVAITLQSSLVELDELPFTLDKLPQVYTDFRFLLSRPEFKPKAPSAAPSHLPPVPRIAHGHATVNLVRLRSDLAIDSADQRSSVPYLQPEFAGGERAALAHLTRYFSSDLPAQYKATRNQVTGADSSCKFSAWLASGALSVRQLAAEIDQYEARLGANKGTEWLMSELLWRDHFRLLHRKHGANMFRYRGLRDKATAVHHDPGLFTRWCVGRTGEPLVDAAMHELMATGYLSNRLLQVVASYWIHELDDDWRAGAAWFEAQLIEFDVCNNQGHWLYIAGLGCDSRGGRQFNVQKQAQTYDPERR